MSFGRASRGESYDVVGRGMWLLARVSCTFWASDRRPSRESGMVVLGILIARNLSYCQEGVSCTENVCDCRSREEEKKWRERDEESICTMRDCSESTRPYTHHCSTVTFAVLGIGTAVDADEACSVAKRP
jgi:hypothetical protein